MIIMQQIRNYSLLPESALITLFSYSYSAR